MPRISIDVDLRGLSREIERLDLFPFVLDEEGRKAMADVVEIVRVHVRDRTPIGEAISEFTGGLGSTGHLHTSIKGESHFAYNEMSGRVYTNVPYAHFVEEGHGEILPHKPGGLLYFRPKGMTHKVFARRVRPVAGVHMFRQGLWASRREISERFAAAMKRVASKMGSLP